MSSTPMTLLLLSCLAALVACATEGFRAGSGGVCPRDQVCSDETPEGLLFRGTDVAGAWLSFDGGIKTVATGGTQTIEVYRNIVGEPAFTRSFDAEVDGDGWSVSEPAPPTVRVTADKQGVGFLRIVERDTGELYDEVDLLALDVAGVSAHANVYPYTGSAPWAMLTGGPRSVYVALDAAGGERLVDEGMALEAEDATSAARTWWDVIELERDEPGTAVVRATTGGVAHEMEVEFVDAIDTLAAVAAPSPIEVGASAFVCIEARLGDLVVHGVSVTYSAEGAVGHEADWLLFGCPMVEGRSVGTGTLVAESGGLTLEVPIEVIPAADQRRADTADEAPRVGTPGARARR